MQEVTFTLQTITPLFMAGTDQAAAELRAPSFRGLMRYWLRALVGGMAGTLEEVKKAESTVFGSTDIGSGVTVRVSEGTKKPLEYHKEGTRFNISGKDYLLWSMEQFRDKPRRLYFPQGTEFQVTLSTRSKDDTYLKQAIASFWLLTHLGSVGSRSRRAAGSVLVQRVQGNTTNFRFEKARNVEDLQTMLKQGIELARQAYNIKQQPVSDAKFDILSPNTCSIHILYDAHQPWLTPDAAMKAIGESLQDYRRKITPLWRRKIFGLPLRDVSNARRASPLLLRLAEIQGDQVKRYVGIAVLFKTTGKDPTGRFVSTKDYDLIEQWFNTFSGKLEVTL
jgi:CRISPR-associated protein Cmr1